MSPEDLKKLLELLGLDASQLEAIRAQAAEKLRMLQARDRLGALPEVSDDAFAASVGAQGGTYLPEVNQWAAPYSPEERARRSVLDAVSEIASRIGSSGTGNYTALTRPFDESPEKGSVYALSQLTATLRPLLEGGQGGMPASDFSQLLGAVGGSGSSVPSQPAQKQTVLLEVIQRARQSGSLSPEDTVQLLNAGVTPSEITAIRKSIGEKVPELAVGGIKLLQKYAFDRDVTGQPQPYAQAAGRALSYLTMGRYCDAVREMKASPELKSIADVWAQAFGCNAAAPASSKGGEGEDEDAYLGTGGGS